MVPGSLGAPRASVIMAAWFMESAAKTLNPNAPQVRVFPSDILITLSLAIM